jgi:coenzyme F420 hydrogenase subunit beta
MTAEFADISIGSGRAKFKGWNTVIVRTDAGAELIKLAKAKHVLETQPIPVESVANLKRAALNKKKRALNNIIAKTGDKNDLLYVGLQEDILNKLLA